jgi:hypothetical protein
MKYADLIFTAIFTFECALKVYGFGLYEYLRSNWNRLDFVIVIGALLDVAFTFWIKVSCTARMHTHSILHRPTIH